MNINAKFQNKLHAGVASKYFSIYQQERQIGLELDDKYTNEKLRKIRIFFVEMVNIIYIRFSYIWFLLIQLQIFV